MNKIVCDYCGNQIFNKEDSEFIIPTIPKIQFCGGLNNNKLGETDGKVQGYKYDICYSCQHKIAKLLNLLNYVDFNFDDLEDKIYSEINNYDIEKEK